MQDVILRNYFIANLNSKLQQLGMSQRDLAQLAGVHFVTVSRILNGHLNPTLDTCEKLGIAAGIPLEKIFRLPVDTPLA